MTRRETVLKHFDEQRKYMDARVNGGIEAHRKGYANLKFTLPDGTEVKSLNFTAVQKSHDFNFGCNMFLLDEFESEEKNKIYREVFPQAFNYAVAPFYWDGLEPTKGMPRYAKDSEKVYRRPSPDLVYEYCKEHNIRVKGHCLVYDQYSPDWIPNDPSEIKRVIKSHIEEIAQRYSDVIFDWDIVNEVWWPCYGKTHNGGTKFYRSDDYVRYPFKIADRAGFERKFINEATHIWDDFCFERTPYYLFLKTLMAENVPFDGIGMQFHQFCRREDEEKYALDRYNPARVYDVLDTFEKLGKPVQISEITIASYNGDSEDMDIQAELLKNMYKIWFSHKSIDGIVYWNLVDGYTYTGDNTNTGMLDMTKGENQFGGALLYNDMTPKPAFKVLKQLVNDEWHTSLSSATNDVGEARIRGFKGMYDVEFEYNGKRYKKEFHLDGRDDFTEKIVID